MRALLVPLLVVAATRVAVADDAELTVGPKAERAMLSTDVQDVSRGADESLVFRVLEHQKITVERGKKEVVVLDVVIAVDVLDKIPTPVNRPRAPDIVNLTLEVAPDGMSATLREKTPGVCTVAKTKTTDAWERFDRKLVTRACAARGTYKWQGNRFRRVPTRRPAR